MKIVELKPVFFSHPGYLKERFGDHVAQISTIMTLKLRSAVLDVARFKLGVVPKDLADLAHKFEMPPQGLEDYKFVFGYEDSGNWVEGSITYDENLKQYIKMYPDHWEIVKKCLGLGRSQSRHACAFVIANDPISSFIPLTKIKGITCTQFTAPSVEAVGGLKMDFLVINSLKDLQAAIKMIQCQGPVAPPPGGMLIDGKLVPAIRLVPRPGFTPDSPDYWTDVWDLPSDQAVFRDVATSQTETVFQFNTPSATQLLKNFAHQREDGTYAISSVGDMAAFTALDRPGPLDIFVTTPGTDGEKKNNMLVEYARRARGELPSEDVPEIFNQMFPDTYGVLTYQEQLQALYQEVTGCTGADAEAFRSDIAKKKKEKIIAAYPVFMKGATDRIGTKEEAEELWKFIQTWAAYGFNKSVVIDTILEDVNGNKKKIKDFLPGDQVKCVDDSGQVVSTEVVQVHDHGELEAFEVEFEDGYKVTCSINHKFLTEEGMKPLHEIIDRGLEILAAAK